MRLSGYRLSTMLFFLLLLFTLTSCTTMGDLTHPKLDQPTLTPGNSAQKVPLDLGIPQEAFRTPYGTSLPDTNQMHAVVTFKINTTLLQQLGAQYKTKAAQSIDLNTLANQLGIDNQTYKQMQSFFGGPGITLHLNNLHTNMVIDAQAGVLAAHLKTKFLRFGYQGVDFFAPDPPIELPQSLASRIKAIIGLDTFSRYQNESSPKISKLPGTVQVNKDDCAVSQYTIPPSEVSQAYGFNGLYNNGWLGQGMTIILPEFDAFDQTDVQHYLDCMQFHGTLKVVNVDNTPPLADKDHEALLDIEMVAGLAPDANIVVYQSNPGSNYSNFWSKMVDVLDQISNDYSTHQQPVMVSISWGESEEFLTGSMLTSVDTALQTMTAVEHLNIFSASGDCGAYNSADYPGTLDVNFPASDPYVVSVGGTILHVDAQNNRTKEAVWQENPTRDPQCDNSWGSGGGLSTIFARPTWQQGYAGIKNQYSNGKRQVPDVSSAAFYLAIYEDGQWDYSGGTSAASPTWASAYALLNQGLVSQTGYYVSGPQVLYTLATQYSSYQPFYDVQDGNNLYYKATPGWDYATGLGTPNLMGIYQGISNYIQHTP